MLHPQITFVLSNSNYNINVPMDYKTMILFLLSFLIGLLHNLRISWMWNSILNIKCAKFDNIHNRYKPTIVHITRRMWVYGKTIILICNDSKLLLKLFFAISMFYYREISQWPIDFSFIINWLFGEVSAKWIIPIIRREDYFANQCCRQSWR